MREKEKQGEQETSTWKIHVCKLTQVLKIETKETKNDREVPFNWDRNTSIYMFEGKSESSPNLRVHTFVWLEMMEKMMVKLISKFVE